MEIKWKITEKEKAKLRKLIADNQNEFYKYRYERNVLKKGGIITKDAIIKVMIACLLTSQQRSGPNSVVGKFLQHKPFLVNSHLIEQSNNIEKDVWQIFKANGLTRYINKISSFFALNIAVIENNNWGIINELKELQGAVSKCKERELADLLARRFKGFGPKQSRNFLQTLGLTRYEIPIDSRITSWLNEFGFPVTLNSTALSDMGYYHFVLDGIQALCAEANIEPCLFDAAVFSSFDNGEWTKVNVIL